MKLVVWKNNSGVKFEQRRPTFVNFGMEFFLPKSYFITKFCNGPYFKNTIRKKKLFFRRKILNLPKIKPEKASGRNPRTVVSMGCNNSGSKNKMITNKPNNCFKPPKIATLLMGYPKYWKSKKFEKCSIIANFRSRNEGQNPPWNIQ